MAVKNLERLLESLEKVHEWPSLYMFKLIFEPEAERLAKVLALFPPESEILRKYSTGGKYLSVTVKEVMMSAEDVVARYSDRRLLHRVLLDLGIAEANLPIAYNVIDKVERDPREVCLQRLGEIGLDPPRAEQALGLTSLTREQIHERYSSNPEFESILRDLEQYERALDALGNEGTARQQGHSEGTGAIREGAG